MADEKKEEIKEEGKQDDSKESDKKNEVVEEKVEVAKEEKPAPSGKFKDLIKEIEDLSVKDLADLVKELEDRFGVSAVAPVAVGASAGSTTVVEEEKSEYTIMLSDAGVQKISVIKAVREIRPDLGLKEAKDLVDSAPKEVKTNVPTQEANVAKAKLEAAGAKVELK